MYKEDFKYGKRRKREQDKIASFNSIKDCIKLADLFGSSVEYWIELQKDYDR